MTVKELMAALAACPGDRHVVIDTGNRYTIGEVTVAPGVYVGRSTRTEDVVAIRPAYPRAARE